MNKLEMKIGLEKGILCCWMPVFINKILLEQSHTCHLHLVVAVEIVWCTKSKMFTI